MTHAPVYFALAQVRFNPVLAMDRYLVDFQDWMRKQGFPEFQSRSQATFNLSLMATPQEASPVPPTGRQNRHYFTDMNGTTGFILDSNSLAIQTTEYTDFEDFSAKFLAALAMTHEKVALSYFERVGSRYLDLVRPVPGEHVSSYLRESFLGMVGKATGDLEYSFSETRHKKDSTVLLTRVVVQPMIDAPAPFPPDLTPVTLKIADKFINVGGLNATIDTDCWYEQRTPFSIEAVSTKLAAIKKEIAVSFKSTVTPHALKVWE
jgi:uncharacterized protein (TIGR04255 family)